MNTTQHHHHHHHKMRGKVEDQPPAAAAAAPSSTASPPSASSSPAHEFSFTISLHQPPQSSTNPEKAKSLPSIAAVDLSPADEIFFHGHLLPLHLLSHLPVSPRSSTNSLDSFTLPREILENNNNNSTTTINNNNGETKERERERERPKSSKSSFSLFGLSKWRKGLDVREKEEEKEKSKRKLRFDVSHVVKRYMRMVRPMLFFRGRRESNIQLRRQPYSFSGNLMSPRGNKQELLRGRRGEYSAPASMRTSPTNSGLLVATGAVQNSTSDSTMEELQAAIQAAIAHCKNSIAMEDKIKC
ncbi:unnamed protein product [Camellia sinensis]